MDIHNKKHVIMAEFTDIRFDARVRKSARALEKAGYKVDLFTYNMSIKKNVCVEEGSVTYHQFAFPGKNNTISIIPRISRILRAFVIIFSIHFYILTHKADIYHAHNLIFLWSSVLASKYFRAKVIYDSHELHSEINNTDKFSGRFFNKIYEIYERLLIPHCHIRIQACDERAEFIAQKYHIQKPVVINNHAPIVPYSGPTDRLRQECKIPFDSKILLYSGGIYANGDRRIDKIIAALPILSNTYLIVLGFMNEDIKRQLLESAKYYFVQDYFHILPPCSPDEIFEYAASADIGVIPLWGKNQNIIMSALNKVSEYLMAGLPIACSSYPNLENIVKNNPVGVVGETFDLSSPDSVAKTIQSILARQYKENFRENALKLAHSIYNWELEEKKLLRIYHDFETS